MFKQMLRYFFRTSAVVLLALLIIRRILMAQIPDTEKMIPIRVAEEKIPVPKRPGTQSIRIVGPPLKVLKFQLDFKRNPRPLDWRFLQRTDKRADVMVDGSIDYFGNFHIQRVLDRGHPRAGNYIRQVMATWKFVPYKCGEVRYYFNVPTRMENMKVQIDARGLKTNYKYLSPNNVLKDGLMYYIEGLKPKNIMIVSK